jgi:hypothetical protein
MSKKSTIYPYLIFQLRKIQVKLSPTANASTVHRLFITLFLLGAGLLFSISNSAQTPDPCSGGCTSKDIKLQRAFLVSDLNGSPLQQCLSGTPVTVYLALDLTTSTPRKGISVYTNLQETIGSNSPTFTVIGQCFVNKTLISTGVNTIIFTQPITWTCGSAVELKETRVSWGTGNTDFCAGSSTDKCGATPSKCWKQGPSDVIIVETFPCLPASTSGPSNVTKCAGQSHTFSVNFTAAQNTTVTSVQWQVCASNCSDLPNATWNNISTGGIYTVTTNLAGGTSSLAISDVTGLNGKIYRAIVNSNSASSGQNCSTAPSATLTVDPTSVGGSIASNLTICSGNQPSSDLTLSGQTGSVVKWQRSTSSDFTTGVTDIANTTPTLTAAAIGALTQNTWFRTVVQSGVCTTANSNSVMITVDEHPTTATVGNTQNVCILTSAGLGGNNPSTGTGTWTKKTGTGTVTFNPNANTANATATVTVAGTYEFTWTISNGVCTASNTNITVNYNTPPPAPEADVTQPTCSELTGTITVTSSITGLSFSLNSTNLADFTNTTGIFNGLVPGNYTLRAKNNTTSCISDGVLKTVNQASSAPSTPVVNIKQAASCSSSTIILEVTSPLGTDFEYNNNDGAWQTGIEFTIQAGDGYSIKARRKSDNSCISSAATCSAEVPGLNNSNVSIEQSSARMLGAADLEYSIAVKPMPNPFSNQVRFMITTSQAGNGTLDLYNIAGQKIKTVYQGYIPAGINYFDLRMGSHQKTELIYILKMDGQKVSGKLLQLGSQ